MLARFNNDYVLEVVHNMETNEYEFDVYDDEDCHLTCGYTEYRDIELYYPMNLIDYILQFCEPEGVSGDYKILDYKTFSDYEARFDANGDWIVEDSDTVLEQSFVTLEIAQDYMKRQFNEENYSDCFESYIDERSAYVGKCGSYRGWRIYENKKYGNLEEKLFAEIRRELERANDGITQYAFELNDTDTARSHIYKAEELLGELEKLLKNKK